MSRTRKRKPFGWLRQRRMVKYGPREFDTPIPGAGRNPMRIFEKKTFRAQQRELVDAELVEYYDDDHEE